MAYTPPTAGAANWDVPLNQALADINATADDSLAGGGASVATQEDTTSLTYTDLATAGPSTSVTLTAARTVLVFVRSSMQNITTADDVFMSFAASGATTVAAADVNGLRHNGSGTAEQYASVAVVACNAGTTTFTAKHRVDGGTGRFTNRVIAAVVT